ncbi:MAG: hypothetical protein FWB86_01405 [Treponema sp.]|nr:hypothetical protein [Treponema sp.]MCL2250360.1 hypothetical protein [Treponema sp.]
MKKIINTSIKKNIFSGSIVIFMILIFTQCAVSSSAVNSDKNEDIIYAGTDDGLFAIDSSGKTETLWTGGSVKKLIKNSYKENFWVILGSEGVLVSHDMHNWEKRNHGLPVKVIKLFDNGKKSFLNIVQEIKDLEINPENPDVMICATKDRIFLSRDQGRSWENLGYPPFRVNGVKAIATAFMPELTVFLSHSLYGVYYFQPEIPNSKWTVLEDGLEKVETTDHADEVSDITVIKTETIPEVFVSQTFRRRIYKLDWDQKRFNIVWKDESPAGTVDSLCPHEKSLLFLYEGNAASLNYTDYSMIKRQDITDAVRKVRAHLKPNCIVINGQEKIQMSELWLIDEPVDISHNIAADKEGFFVPVEHARSREGMTPYLEMIKNSGLNMIVLDMKDDFGRLRFTPQNQMISQKGRVFRPLDIDTFLHDMKNRGIYTVARIVVFKDQELASKENGRFAVWDSRNSKPWRGYRDYRLRKEDISEEDRNDNTKQFFPANDPNYEIVRSLYNEIWVDPYSEEVWEYIAQISNELHERGFDEIQYDYIRFPTDGLNLGDAHYRFQDSGMDMESAIYSFLNHIRKKVTAPISLDIYGANSYYRTGARTGQEVELLAKFVDVICPMYYPSHFDQSFYAQAPAELRPWRIYYYGTFRANRISRGKVIIRPYVQAFFLNVSYDRQYYNADYIRRQIEGVREIGKGGFTYWNEPGRYVNLPLAKN